MSEMQSHKAWEYHGQDGAVYACTDGTIIRRQCETVQISGRTGAVVDIQEMMATMGRMYERNTPTVPKSWIQIRRCRPYTVLISGTQLSRDMKKILHGHNSRTYTFPNTVVTVDEQAFRRKQVFSVRFNEGLKTLKRHCFASSEIRRLVLPSSVKLIDICAFHRCSRLEYADLSAAHGLKCIEGNVFLSCNALRRVVLNDGLEKIYGSCFEESGLEEVVIPGSVRKIDYSAFSQTPLRRVHFLGATAREPQQDPKLPSEHSSSEPEENYSESEQQPVIGEGAFASCKDLKQVTFDHSSLVTEIQCKAFWNSGLESFVAPPSLRKISTVAFKECHDLKTFELNEDIQELGLFCLWGTGITKVYIPPHIKMTREQLGLDQKDPTVLRIPDGFEAVRGGWFACSDIEKLIVPSGVRELGDGAFLKCARLREVVFEPDSRLETIGDWCFAHSTLEQITVPKSVRNIGSGAFYGCKCLCSFVFEEGSRLEHVGEKALGSTPQEKKTRVFPSAAQIDAEDTNH